MPQARAAPSADPGFVRRRAPSVMLSRLCGPLAALLACGIARPMEGGGIELFLNRAEAAHGGMITISLRVAVRCKRCVADTNRCPDCGGRGFTDELFSAWLAVPPEVSEGAELLPSVVLPEMVHPVRFVMRLVHDRAK